MRTLTEEQRKEILRRYKAGHQLKAIAADFGTYAAFVSRLALQRGCRARYPFQRGLLTVKLRPQELGELRKLAKEHHVKPETIAREAIAAYLGLVR